jgi:hypothetical protein
MGTAIGIAVDAQDHIWIVHRPDTLTAAEVGADENPPSAKCCKRAPPVLQFDQEGNLLKAWGGPGEGYAWPESNHGLFVDHKGIVWIGGNGTNDAHVLKFTQDGKFIAQFGNAGKTAGSNDTQNFGRVAKIFVDPKANEAAARSRLPRDRDRRFPVLRSLPATSHTRGKALRFRERTPRRGPASLPSVRRHRSTARRGATPPG